MNLKKYLSNRSNPGSRFLARILDYSLFYSLFILPLFLGSIIDSDLLHLAIVFLIPMLWIPFEAFFISFFATTPGKWLCGIKVFSSSNEKLSFIVALKRSFGIWTKGLGCNLPFLNIYFFIKNYKKIKKDGLLEIDRSLAVVIYQKFKRSVRSFFTSGLTLFFILFFTAEYQVREVITSSDQQFLAKQFFAKDPLKWKTYKHPEGRFEIDFPDLPLEEFVKLPIPKTKDFLDYYTLIHKHKNQDIEFSLHYTELPRGWLKWRPALLLKGALKIISTKLTQGKILKKSCKDYHQFPALEFIIQKKNNQESSGRLILVDNVLYKIEVTYPKEKKEAVEENLSIFLQSFSPTK